MCIVQDTKPSRNFVKVKTKVALSFFLTKRYAMKTYGGVDI
jgi:hypothetical protein